MRDVRFALLALCFTSTTASSTVLDDQQCTFASKTKTCEPAYACAFQYRFGDLSLDQSCRVVVAQVARVPQQLHLAFAGTTAGTAMTISWSTYTKVDDPKVWLGTSRETVKLVEDDNVGVQAVSYYSDRHYSLYTYHATLSGLKANTCYFFKVGCGSCDDNESSVISSFTTARGPPTASIDAGDTSNGTNTTDDAFEVLVYGDFGLDENARATSAYLANLTRPLAFIYHIGDISYADNAFLSLNEVTGFHYEETYNRWMNSLAPIMSNVPYMVLVGNHEAECHSPLCFLSASKKEQLGNYSAFNVRFKMPSTESGGVKNMWYSFDYASLHFTSISSETDFPDAPENSLMGENLNGHFGNQLQWLEADLKAANANRDAVPWLIVGMHRAMYTLNAVDGDGNPTGVSSALQRAFEALFLRYKVDVVVAGHVHAYERHFPIAKGKKIADGVSSDGKTYTAPKAPVYLVTGAAGNSEGHDQFHNATQVEWVAVSDRAHYGISSLKTTRGSLTFTLIGTHDDVVYDEFVITKG